VRSIGQVSATRKNKKTKTEIAISFEIVLESFSNECRETKTEQREQVQTRK